MVEIPFLISNKNMKKIGSKLWNVYVCTQEEMDIVVKRRSHCNLKSSKKLVSYCLTKNRKSQYYIDDEYFNKTLKEVIIKFIINNKFINISENMTEEECDKKAIEVSYLLINNVLKNL